MAEVASGWVSRHNRSYGEEFEGEDYEGTGNMFYFFFVFFFQAEDGIRDIGVTGVQTCALPISWRYVSLK